MNFIDKVKEFIVGKQFARMDLDHHYSNAPYNEAKAYGERNKNINGVQAVMGKIQKARQSYLAEMKQYIEGERSREQASFSQLQKMEQKKQFFKWLCLGSVLALFIVSEIDAKAHTSVIRLLTFLLGMVVFVAFFASIMISLVFKMRENLAQKAYQNYMEEAQAGFNRINGAHNKAMNTLYTEIDNLYLASLDPAYREVILMRRDQERQHREAMQLQKETMRLQKEAMQTQKKHQQAVEEEQRRTRQAQEELLAIEKERERRRRGY